MADEIKKPVLEVNLKEVGSKVFDSVESLRDWIAHQRATWREIFGATEGGGESQKKARSLCGNILDRLDKLETVFNKDVHGSQFSNPQRLQQEIEQAFGKGQAIPADLPRVQIIRHAIRQYGPETGCGTAEYIIERWNDNNAAICGRELGIMLGLLQDENVQKKGDFQLIVALRDTGEQLLNADHENARQWLVQKTNEVNLFLERYKEVMALKAPLDYWEGKRVAHNSNMKRLGGAFIGILIVCGGLLVWSIQHSGAKLSQIVETMSTQDGGVGAVRLWTLVPGAAANILALVALLWVLKIVVRLFFTQVHSHADAAERVVMVQTYLSLLLGKGMLEGKPGVDKEDTKTILEQLFRHSATGVFPDDAAPQFPIVELANAAKRT